MSDIDNLIAEREKVRETEKELTAKIKTERARISAERKQAKTTDAMACVTVDEWKRLKSENARLKSEKSRLKGMIAVLLKDTGLTYKFLAEKLYCSPERARQIVVRMLRQLQHPSVSNNDTDS